MRILGFKAFSAFFLCCSLYMSFSVLFSRSSTSFFQPPYRHKSCSREKQDLYASKQISLSDFLPLRLSYLKSAIWRPKEFASTTLHLQEWLHQKYNLKIPYLASDDKKAIIAYSIRKTEENSQLMLVILWFLFSLYSIF